MNTNKRLDDLLNERGLSLRHLCQICDLPYSTLKSMRARGTQLSVDTIEQICTGLDISLAQFFDVPSGDNLSA